MYYLYSKKGRQSDDQSSSSDGRTVSSGPVSVRSSGRHSLRHPYHYPSIAEESSSIDTPEGAEQRRRPEPPWVCLPDYPDQEYKQETKQNYEQAKRILRRRGLEEHDYTEEVMQPRRPNRTNCHRCYQDIVNNDSQHRIQCSSRDKHVFCKSCFIDYIEVWVEGSAHYDLRVGKQSGSTRGLYSLPCMLPSCTSGCLRETFMQPLLPNTLFLSCRQKLARLRTELSRSKPRVDGSSEQQLSLGRRGKPRDDSPPQPELSSRRLDRANMSQQQDLFLQEQQFKEQHNEFAHSQRQARQYLHQQQLALPMPPALRNTSSASIGGTSQSTHASQNTQKTQKTQKSVRFSIMGDDDEDHDNVSSGSSASSLTTRFPVSLDGSRKTEKEESISRYRQSIIQQQAQYQDTNKGQSSAFTTCQCCYEEIPQHVSPIITCGPHHHGMMPHRFCAKCVRLYVEEWVFGAATYTLRPGPHDSQGQTTLLLPCLHGDCTQGVQDDQVGLALSPRSMEQYRAKINPMRIQKQDDEERLVQMAIRLSLEQEEIKRRVAKLHEEQRSVERGDAYPLLPGAHGQGNLPTYAVTVPETTLSNTSSLTSFNTTIFGHARSLPDMPTGTLNLRNLKFSAEADQLQKNREKSIHEVEEAMTQAKVRICPHCQTKFLKDENFCNKLKCPTCHTAICYICRNVIPTQGYEHFCIHKEGGCAACLGRHCPLWTQVDDDRRRDTEEMRVRGLDEANRIWENSLLQQDEIRVDVDSLLKPPSEPNDK